MKAAPNNLRAGIGTILAIILFSFGLLGWNLWLNSRKLDYFVRFTPEQGVYGLSAGSPVWLGGMKCGAVSTVKVEVKDGQITGYLVGVRVERHVPIYQATRFEASGAGISGDAVLEIREIGKTRTYSGAIPSPTDGNTLPQGSTLAAFNPQPYRGLVGGPGAKPLNSLIQTWMPDQPGPDSLTRRLTAIADEAPAKSSAIRHDIRSIADTFEPDLKAWRADFTSARTAADHAIEAIGSGDTPAEQTIRGQMTLLKSEFEHMPKPEIKRMEFASNSMDQAIASIKALGNKSGELSKMLADGETSLGRVSADFAIASQELSATYKNAVSQPWQLLETPSSQALQDAARIELVRIYSQAAVAHQRAMKGIEDALRRDSDLLQQSPNLATLLQSRLDASNAIFQAQTMRMEDLLLGTIAPAATPAPVPAANNP